VVTRVLESRRRRFLGVGDAAPPAVAAAASRRLRLRRRRFIAGDAAPPPAAPTGSRADAQRVAQGAVKCLELGQRNDHLVDRRLPLIGRSSALEPVEPARQLRSMLAPVVLIEQLLEGLT